MLVACPKCQRTFPAEGSTFCPHDGSKLLAIDDVTPVRDAKDPLVTSTVAGRYEVRRVIANGGMGRVYEARELTRQERVAIKILHADVAEDEVNIERFRREATTSQQLDHPHVVKVMDFAATAMLPGRPGKSWFLVMEYLDGGTPVTCSPATRPSPCTGASGSCRSSRWRSTRRTPRASCTAT